MDNFFGGNIMNELTIGFEVEFGGTSERFVSEEAYKTQQKLKDDYMQRDMKHSETISELREQLAEKQDYIKTLEDRINSQKKVINNIYGSAASANITNSLLDWKTENLQNENKVLKERLKEATGIDYTDSTDYISRLHKNVLNQRKELRKQLEEKQDYIKTLEERIASQRAAINSCENQKLDAQIKYYNRYKEDMMGKDNTIAQLEAHNENQRKELANLNKVIEKEHKRNKELEELYSSAQRDVSMLNLKVMKLNQGIRNSTDLTWKAKYDELETKYTEDSDAFNGVINELRKRLKDNDSQNNTTCKKLADDLAYITGRCAKAEHTIDAIKEALADGDYIHHIRFKEE